MMSLEQAQNAIQTLVAQSQEFTNLLQHTVATADARAAAEAAVAQASTSRRSAPLVDTRSFGKLALFDGDRNGWRDWSLSFASFMAAACAEAGPAMEWAAKQPNGLTMDDVQLQDTNWVEISRQLFLALSLQCKGDPAVMIQNAPGQNGLEVWRKMCQFYEPATRARRRQKLAQLLQPTPAKTLDETMRTIETWENEVTRFEGKFGQKIDIEVRIAALATLAHSHLQEHIFLNADKYDTYVETRQLIQEYVETYMTSERSASRNGPAPMDVCDLEVRLNALEKGAGGKGKDKGKNKDKSSWGTKGKTPWTARYDDKGGGKYNDKGGGKHNEMGKNRDKWKYDDTGKGKDDKQQPFEGYCGACGKWGH